jgi:hypothetical protein
MPCSPRRRILVVTVTLRNWPTPRRLTPMSHSQGLTVATTARTTRFCRTQRSVSALPASPDKPAWPESVVRDRRRSYDTACVGSRGSAQSSARPALTSAPALPRPPHPQPTFVTTYDRPSPSGRHGRENAQNRISVKWNILREGVDGIWVFCPTDWISVRSEQNLETMMSKSPPVGPTN